KDGEKTTLVVPDSKNVIESVTADSVCHIARSFGWTVEKRAINYDELKSFDEVFAAGTAAALVPIKSITMKSRNDTFNYLDSDEPGPVCLKLLDNLKGIQTGRYEDKFGWNVKVEQESRESFAEGGDETKNGNVDVMNA
ncbi:branched-chain amino acid aminotransferase, partial [Aureobasidium melanogenum]